MVYTTQDEYSSFDELAADNTRELDYRIVTQNTDSPVSIIAIHGGNIEFTTSEVTKSIAGNEFNYYLFEGLKLVDNSKLHISSYFFDEPKALEFVTSSDICISIHGFKEYKKKMVYVDSNKDPLLSEMISEALLKTGLLEQDKITSFAEFIRTAPYDHGYKKSEFSNRTNVFSLCKKTGVQIELSRALRDVFKNDAKALDIFTMAVKRAIHDYLEKQKKL